MFKIPFSPFSQQIPLSLGLLALHVSRKRSMGWDTVNLFQNGQSGNACPYPFYESEENG
jgi:hypothetical protein